MHLCISLQVNDFQLGINHFSLFPIDAAPNHVLRYIYDGSPVDAESALNPLICGAWFAGFSFCSRFTHNREIITPTAITIIMPSRTTSPFRPRCSDRIHFWIETQKLDVSHPRILSTNGFVVDSYNGTLGPNQLPLNRFISPGHCCCIIICCRLHLSRKSKKTNLIGSVASERGEGEGRAMGFSFILVVSIVQSTHTHTIFQRFQHFHTQSVRSKSFNLH